MIAATPSVDSAAPATAATAAAPASVEAASGFDAILMLQGLAATTGTLETAAFEAADTSDALASEDGSDDDELTDDIEASLAFLADLIAATSHRSAGDFEAGAGEGGDSGGESSALPLAANDADAGFALALGSDEKADALRALTAVDPHTVDQGNAGDASQNLARAAEMLAQGQRAAPTESAKVAVPTHVRDPRWADDFGARVSLMVRAGESTASLQLTPVDLGPVEVNVTVKDSQATIHFGATQADTRALIEASLPKLRELLASQGFSLMDASVSSGFSRQQQNTSGSALSDVAGTVGEPESSAQMVQQIGLLDLYA